MIVYIQLLIAFSVVLSAPKFLTLKGRMVTQKCEILRILYFSLGWYFQFMTD